jgi:polysaccharide pyruvyl transferase WcaK-like protein
MTQNKDPSIEDRRVVERICLLTPYSGTNFGDGAIQQATIDGILERLPHARLTGITLAPEDTTARHGIPAVAITGLATRFYSESLFDSEPLVLHGASLGRATAANDAGAGAKRDWHVLLEEAWKGLKSIPVAGFIARGMLRSLRACANVLHEIRYLFRSARFLKRQHLIIVSGGGQLDDEWGGPWGHPYALFRWALLGRVLGVPMVVLSVGVGKLESPVSRRLVGIALRCASYRSFRDEGSKALLAQMSVVRGDPVVPDLAFSLARVPPQRTGKPRRVAIGMIAYGRPGSWPRENPAAYERYLGCMTEFARWVLQQGLVLSIVRSSGADRYAVAELRERLQSNGADLRDVQFPELESLSDFLEVLEDSDLVVGSRLHTVILAHCLHIPCIAVSFDRKVDAQMQNFRQERYCHSILEVLPEALAGSFETMVLDYDGIRAGIAASALSCRQRLDRQFDSVLGCRPIRRDRSSQYMAGGA